MKCFLFISLFVFLQPSQAQTYVLIPDTRFATYLKEIIPKAVNNGSLNTSSPVVTGLQSMSIPNLGIANLSGIQYFTSLNILDISGNWITVFPLLPNSLQTLVCSNTSIAGLSIPSSLQSFVCISNSLTSLPALPASLKSLHCFSNRLTHLPKLPNSLEKLDCSSNLLTSMPSLPSSLQDLACIDNSLTSLPVLPASLKSLACQFNRLTDLPLLPDSLQLLTCYSNSLTGLPSLPASLESLDCHKNLLTSLPSLSFNLRNLICYSNSLTALPPLPASLSRLECHYNLLVGTLPALPDSLLILDCSYNRIWSLPKLPTGLRKLWCRNNFIACFPAFPTTILPPTISSGWTFYIDIDNNPYSCLPNYLPSAMAAHVLTYPLCNQIDVNPCAYGIAVDVESTNTKNDPIQINPNPVTDKIIIVSAAKEKFSVRIYNLTGQLFFYEETVGRTEYDLDHLSEGVYVVTIRSANHSISKKIIKLR